MADSTFRVNFGFTADTAQAKASLQDLQAQLDKLIRTTSTKSSGAGLTKEIQNAVTAAAELKAHLQNATNVQTGVLDFSKLNDSIQRSGKSLMDYGDELLKLGPAGEESFKSLARSVASSEIPLKRTSKMVNDLWISLKNAARWQVSASVLHGFMGALQTSYHYAQDLNESLNNIRIVTGQSTEQMAKFAEQANKTARSLSASTLDYTNASLIYYQQGEV